MHSQLHMPRKLQRSTLIAGIFAVGGLLLCCLSGTIGWFNSYWAIASATAACCFFVLIACSTAVSLLSSQQNVGAHRDGAALPRFVQTFRELTLGKNIQLVFAIAVLAAAHIYILSKNVSPSENLLGNHDQGMYLAAASHLKTNGSHAMATDWIRQSPVEYKRFLTKEISPSLKTESSDAVTNTGTQAGFYLMDDNGSSQYIQFPPGYPTLLALFWSLGGYSLVLYSNIITCLLCGLMLAAVCRNFIGRAGALATWLLFLFCPLTLWSANHLYAEPTLLLLWLIALWSLGFSEEFPWLSGILASLSIGAAFLVKIDALPLLVLPLACALLGKGRCLRFRASFLSLSIVAYALATGFYLHYSKPYFEFTLSGLLSAHFFLGVLCALLLSVTFFASRAAICRRSKSVGSQDTGAMRGRICATSKKKLKLSAIIRTNAYILRYGLAISISLILIYFYSVRPHMPEPHRVFDDGAGADIESLREQTFYRLGWYFTPFGLALASMGLTAAFIKRAHLAQLAFTGIALLFLLYYSYDIHCTPYQPYAMRRLFPFVVPALCFGIPFLIQTMAVKLRSAKIAGLLILLVTAILLPQFQQISRKLILRENYTGLYEYLLSVSQELPENERILINGKGKACIYAAPLKYIFGQSCILIYPDYRDRNYHAMTRQFTEDGTGSIYVLGTSPNDRMSTRSKIISTKRLSDTLQTTYAGTATTDYPDDDIKPFKLSLYLTELKIP